MLSFANIVQPALKTASTQKVFKTHLKWDALSFSRKYKKLVFQLSIKNYLFFGNCFYANYKKLFLFGNFFFGKKFFWERIKNFFLCSWKIVSCWVNIRIFLRRNFFIWVGQVSRIGRCISHNYRDVYFPWQKFWELLNLFEYWHKSLQACTKVLLYTELGPHNWRHDNVGFFLSCDRDMNLNFTLSAFKTSIYLKLGAKIDVTITN